MDDAHQTARSRRHLKRVFFPARRDDKIGKDSPLLDKSDGSSAPWSGRATSFPMLLRSKRGVTMPPGSCAVYVGSERRRFIVKARSFNHPLFVTEILEKARDEFGFEQNGPLKIPCDVAFFEHILFMVQSSHGR